MLPRVLEPEVMDSPEEARDYDAMDHSAVNRVFVADFLQVWQNELPIVDVGTGTAQIPIELCRREPRARVIAIDLAEHMLAVGRENVRHAGLEDRLDLRQVDAKGLPFADGAFGALISNSIVHHIPEPGAVLAEMVRVVAPEGILFVRDLLRPADDATVRHLVETHAAGANAHQRKMFDDSLRAALTLDEMQALAVGLGFDAETVRQTTDRHWTWSARKRRTAPTPGERRG
jgi:ubiquinone/menaquinone biosynthesis C-methylase UbiE